MTSNKIISFVIPCYNEEAGIATLVTQLEKLIPKLPHYLYEIILVNDGSKDNTSQEILKYIKTSALDITLVELQRNYGKEIALTAGLEKCKGDAAMMIDADLQYPIEKIPEFLKKWEEGSLVVVGLRDEKKTNSLVDKAGSKLFAFLTSVLGIGNYNSRALDFRLIDRQVITEFLQYKDKNRLVRNLIDSMGYSQSYIPYQEKNRAVGTSTMSFYKRLKLALNTFIYQSNRPLFFISGLGILITILSFIIGVLAIIDNISNKTIFGFSGPFQLGILNLFLNGIVLISLGFVAAYIGIIKQEILHRPLYIVKKIMRKD